MILKNFGNHLSNKLLSNNLIVLCFKISGIRFIRYNLINES